jgi:acyl-CoA reductase-like NAD-dependent aldehyde dehydrogenase
LDCNGACKNNQGSPDPIQGDNRRQFVLAALFGGVEKSGYGREGSVHGLDDDLHTTYLCQGQLD